MRTVDEIIKLQADSHPVEHQNAFESPEAYCLYLMHLRAYHEAMSAVSDKTVLDIGCNDGCGSELMAARARAVTGVDVSAAAIAKAQERPPRANMKFSVVDGGALPFEASSFDVVTAFQIIEHIAKPEVFLTDARRVLKPGGVALLTTPNAALRLNPGREPWNPFHVHEFRGDELSQLLCDVFREVRIRGLFAVPAIYTVELERIRRSRERQLSERARRLPSKVEMRAELIGFLKAVLPSQAITVAQAGVRSWSRRSTGAKRDASGDPTNGLRSQVSTADLFYKETGIDEALDLLAVCVK